ncbi:flavodoxin domain-containing protein [Oleiharenicola lentus]|uniref:flavodoxin domain-containing protein n=1 Tax=Oleiharenicola lentus TaxID=2508720 RepID=UPI003F66A0F8
MSSTLAIYFATMTGNAEMLAGRLATRAQQEGWNVFQKNLSDVKVTDLTAQTFAVFIVSTWGDGEPPGDAQDFQDQLLAANAPRLPELRYAVFGLGDHSYSEYNAFARRLDERLAALGAQRQHERAEADVQFEAPYEAWEPAVLTAAKSAAA